MLGVKSARIRLWPWWRPWSAWAAAGKRLRASADPAASIATDSFECFMRYLQWGTGPDTEDPRAEPRPVGDYGLDVAMVRARSPSACRGSRRRAREWDRTLVGCRQVSVSSQSRASRAEVGLRSERGPVLLAVMLSIGLVAIDSTILATAVPSVVSDLGGFTSFPWLFSVYLLAQAISVLLYGKLADLYGRKPLMLLGVGLFVAGSLLCGVAWSMTALIVFRLVQGLGAGAIQPIGMTILGDIYSLRERATVQGYVASVWAMSALIGPTLGGVFSDTIGWRWIFFVNLPLGAAAGWVLWRRFEERVERRRHRIDVTGSVLLALGGTLVLLALLEGGVEWAWDSATSIGLFAAAAVVLAAFVLVERRGGGPGPPRPASVCPPRRRSSSRRSCSSNGVRASRSCRCGCSGCGCSTWPTPARSWSGC